MLFLDDLDPFFILFGMLNLEILIREFSRICMFEDLCFVNCYEFKSLKSGKFVQWRHMQSDLVIY